jgi:hypothetical protein
MESDTTQFPTRSRKKYRDLRSAVISGDVDAVEFVMVSQSLTADSNVSLFQKSLLYAIRRGYTAMCRQLMSHAAIDPSPILFSKVLIAATEEGHFEVVKLFGPHLGSDLGRVFSRRAFLRACETGHLATAKFLYDTSGCDHHEKSMALSSSISNNDTGMLKCLLENGFADSEDSKFNISCALDCDQTDNSIFELILDTR